MMLKCSLINEVMSVRQLLATTLRAIVPCQSYLFFEYCFTRRGTLKNISLMDFLKITYILYMLK